MADRRVKQLREFIEPFRVPPGKKIVLARDFDPSYKADFLDKEEGEELLQQGVEQLSEFQARLAAQDTYSVLVCLQALDAAGKDGTIRHVMSGVNPQGVEVHGFKVPSAGGARPRLPLALPEVPARARQHRHLQPLPLRRGARGARARGDPGQREAAQGGPDAPASGAAATAPSTTGSVTSSRTATRSSSCS